MLTIGNFDGLHRGHQALLRSVVERGRELGARTGVYTFDPHPRRVLDPDRAPPRLMCWEQLELGLQDAGIDFLVREPFTTEFSKQSAEVTIQPRTCPRSPRRTAAFPEKKAGNGSG